MFNIIDYSAVSVSEKTVDRVMEAVKTIPEAEYYLAQYKENKLNLSSSAREALDKLINPQVEEEIQEEIQEEQNEEETPEEEQKEEGN